MNRPLEVLRGAVTAIRERQLAVTRQSERTVMLGTILLASAVSAATGYVLTQCYSVDVLSSLLFIPEDCSGNWGMNIGRHCFSDYAMVVGAGMRPNPWVPYPMFPPNPPYRVAGPAATMMPHLLFGLPAKWLGAPRLGLIGYLLALTIAVLSPAVWAARGARGLERVVVFVALGAAAIPAWAAIDRGNSAGFVVPIALVFLVALCRRRWGLVAIMVVLAALVKPQFAVLVVALLAARQWRLGGLALAGVATSNIAAYLLWPRDFPDTITQSIHNLFTFYNRFFPRANRYAERVLWQSAPANPGYRQGRPNGRQNTGRLPRWSAIADRVCRFGPRRRLRAGSGAAHPACHGGHCAAGRRRTLPPLTIFYYLVFVLPVAALVVRDPDGPPGAGVFDQLAIHGGRRRAVGICVSLAAALSIAQIPLLGPIGHADIPGQMGTRGVIGTTVFLAPILWLVACAVIIVSYARRPAPSRDSDQGPAREGPRILLSAPPPVHLS